jgi:DNA replication licensing factor MCM2
MQVMLDSFLQAQKVSVRASLTRAFRKYLTFGEENNQLLMHALQGLVRDAEKYHQLRYNTTADTVKVYMVDLENKAKSLNIFNLRSFYASTMFTNHGFRYDDENKVIIKTF